MRQRIIIVPKDKVAQEALDFDKATKEQLIELPIGEEEFLCMYNSGIIELINMKGNANIDDFEDDSVTGKVNLNMVINTLSLKESLGNNFQIRLIQKLANLFREALERDTGVYFYF